MQRVGMKKKKPAPPKGLMGVIHDQRRNMLMKNNMNAEDGRRRGTQC